MRSILKARGRPNWGPIRRSDLAPYLDKATKIVEIELPLPDTDIPNSKLKQIKFAFSPPVRFAEKYGQEMLGSPNIGLCLNCNLARINVFGSMVSSFTVQNYEGQSADIKGGTYILACGGVENSRLLLWSNIASNGELLKEQARVTGRYWLEHPHFTIGVAVLASDFGGSTEESGKWLFFAPSPELMAEKGILNCGLRLMRLPHGEMRQILEDVACVAPSWANWAYAQVRNDSLCARRFSAAWEQEPRFENRVGLGEAKDRLGISVVELHWTKSELDLKTIRESAMAFATYLAEQDLGRAKIMPWVFGEADYPEDDDFGGCHHMGGTRMAIDPADGVVDQNCRVFGVPNLYVAGSSVFPSSGHANPTLTIVQLALRLSEHLRSKSGQL
jgi:choline dehydrogenase-like flavoprotein